MPSNELDWLFSPAAQLASAQKIFSDRVPQQEAFDNAVRACRRRLLDGGEDYAEPQNLIAPRKNVLHFFGMGGIGKTELLTRLKRRLDGGGPETPHWSSFDDRNASVGAFYDCKRSIGPSPEGLLLTIRQALAASRIKCTAFDLLIARYWATNYPGDSLEAYISKRGSLAEVDDATGLSKQIETSVGEITASLLGLGVGVSGEALHKVLKTTVTAVTEFGPRKTALGACKMLTELLRAPANAESLPYYATALAWDLDRSRNSDGSRILLVVFLDHLEEVSEPFELMLQQIAWLLPQTLFVTGGRNLLRWSNEKATGLFRVGAANWPLLVEGAVGEPRQHRVGPLTESDTAEFLSQALVSHDLSESELQRITHASGGLPYHLDLMVQHWASVSDKRTPTAADVLVPFPDLARRVLRDLDFREQKLVFASTLFDRFESTLISDVADVQDGVARRLLQKPLFQPSDDPEVFGMDRTLRCMFIDLAEESDADWSIKDWRQMAERAFAACLAKLSTCSHSDQRFWLAQSLQIARAFGLDGTSLVPVAEQAVEGAEWDPTWAVQNLKTDQPEQSWMDDFSSVLSIIFSRQARPRSDVAIALEEILFRHDDDTRFDLARYFSAEALRDVGQVYKSRKHFGNLIASRSTFEPRALHGRIHLLRREGNIRQAVEQLEASAMRLPVPDRLHGEIIWTQARFDDAFGKFRSGYDKAKSKNQVGEAWLCAVYQAFALAWTDPARASELLERFESEKPDHTSSFADGIELLANFLISNGAEEQTAGLWAAGRSRFTDLQQTSLVCYFDLAAIFSASVSGFRSLAEVGLQALAKSCEAAAIHYLDSIGRHIVHDEPLDRNVAWIDDQVGQRWADAIKRRRGVSDDRT